MHMNFTYMKLSSTESILWPTKTCIVYSDEQWLSSISVRSLSYHPHTHTILLIVDLGDWTWDLLHVKQIVYHSATVPCRSPGLPCLLQARAWPAQTSSICLSHVFHFPTSHIGITLISLTRSPTWHIYVQLFCSQNLQGKKKTLPTLRASQFFLWNFLNLLFHPFLPKAIGRGSQAPFCLPPFNSNSPCLLKPSAYLPFLPKKNWANIKEK